MEQFYSEQERAYHMYNNNKNNQQSSKLEEDWKDAVRKSTNDGKLPQNTWLRLDHRPSRTTLNNLSTPKYHLVAHYEPPIYPNISHLETDDDYVPASYLVKAKRPGIMGMWDSMWDASNK